MARFISPDRRRVLAMAAAGAVWPGVAPAAAPAAVLYGCQSGRETLDEGHGGGNPFASALIDCLADRGLTLDGLPARMRALTAAKSEGFQAVDGPPALQPGGYRLGAPGDARVALVLIVSDYSRPGVPALPGAVRDGRRMAGAFAGAGFAVTSRVDLDRPGMIAALDDFAARARRADAAVIYATGHGVEAGGVVRLLARDYVPGRGVGVLPDQSVTIPTLASAAQARTVNLMFWAGCRSPFTS